MTERPRTAALVGALMLVAATISVGPVAPSAHAIVGGSPISQEALSSGATFGWLVRLEGGIGDCSGSLVSAEWILTAAHCADVAGDAGLTVYVGDSTSGIPVGDVVLHPGWDGSHEADLALMHLMTPSSRTPIALAGVDDGLVRGTVVALAGWGATTAAGTSSAVPSSGSVEVSGLNSTVVETGGSVVGCSGDSGGPVLIGQTLVGVISSSDPTCSSFTLSPRVSAFRGWITEVIDPDSVGNRPPTAVGGSIEAPVGEPVEVVVEYSDPDGDDVQIVDVALGIFPDADLETCTSSQPQQFRCTLTPPAGFVGATSFSYVVEDEHGLRATGTWSITFVAEPVTPIAEDVAYTVTVDRTATITLPASDANGTDLTFTVFEGPSHGTLSDCLSGICEYTPDPGYVGEDEFSFTASNGVLQSDTGVVSISVIPNTAPVAGSTTYTVTTGVSSSFVLPGQDPNGDPLVYRIVDGPSHGVVTGCESDMCSYTSDAGFTGLDRLTFAVSDGVFDSEVGTVMFEVLANARPIAGDVTATTKAGQPVLIDLAAFDEEGDRLTFDVVEAPAHGTVVDCDDGQCLYTPEPGFTGTDSFSYTASDQFGISAPATASVEVLGSSWSVTTIDTGQTSPETMAASIVEPNTAFSVRFSGSATSLGTFDGTDDVFGIDRGVILSTGRAVDSLGPNVSAAIGTDHGGAGDDALTYLAGRTTFDATSLEFELIPTTATIDLRFVLASEEYRDGGYVTDGFEDIAMISIGDVTCLLPGDAPISVRSVRQGTFVADEFGDEIIDHEPMNSDLYVDNPVGGVLYDTELNGFIVARTCSVPVEPGTPVRVKLAIADAGDGNVDSVLLVGGFGGPVLDDPLGELVAAVADTAPSLTKKVEQIADAIRDGRTGNTCGLLTAFANEVTAKAGKSLTEARAETLGGLARRLAESLGCS